MSIKKIALCSLLAATIITNNSNCISNNFDEMSELKERYYSIIEKENKEDKKQCLEDLLLDIKNLKPSYFEILLDSVCIGLSSGMNQTFIKYLYEKPSAITVIATIAGCGLTGYSLEMYAKDSYEITVLTQLEKDITSELANLEQK